MSSALLLAGVALTAVGFFAMGFYWASGLYYFPRWKEGFEQGYELAKKHYTSLNTG